MNRRGFLVNTAAVATMAEMPQPVNAGRSAASAPAHPHKSPWVRASDGTELYVQDVGSGRPILFVSAWTLDSRFWGTHVVGLSRAGFRCVAFDRRGHGRSDAPCAGYDPETLAQDLRAVLEQLDLRDVVLVAHSLGSGESARYLARHGTDRVSKLVLVAPTTPFLLKTPDNPQGISAAMVESSLESIAHDFPTWVGDNEKPFFTADTGAEMRAWIKAMMLSVPLPIAYALRESAGLADFRDDVRAIRQPTLIVHGDQDASAPLELTGARTAKLLSDGKLVVFENAPHGLPLTHRDRFLTVLQDFARG
jgi:pimeloyl-ACP methyl ester carboxylesterase